MVVFVCNLGFGLDLDLDFHLRIICLLIKKVTNQRCCWSWGNICWGHHQSNPLHILQTWPPSPGQSPGSCTDIHCSCHSDHSWCSRRSCCRGSGGHRAQLQGCQWSHCMRREHLSPICTDHPPLWILNIICVRSSSRILICLKLWMYHKPYI